MEKSITHTLIRPKHGIGDVLCAIWKNNMTLRKKLKAHKRRKDYEKKRNIEAAQKREVRNFELYKIGKTKKVTIQYPKSKKIKPKKTK